MPCTVEGIAWNWNNAGRPNKILCASGSRTIENSTILVFPCLPPWLTRVNGRCRVPMGHRLCPVNPTSGPVAGFNSSFQASGSCQKQCSYMTSVELSPSMYTQWTFELRICASMTKESVPFQFGGRGSSHENVKLVMVAVIVSTLSQSPVLSVRFRDWSV